MNVVRASILRLEVAGEVPNCPNPVVDRHIVHATRELCDRVALWQVAGSVDASGQTLDLSVLEDDDAEVVRVMPRGVAQAGQQLPQYVRPDPAGSDLGFYVYTRRTLQLTKAPDSSDFTVTVQLRPAVATLNVPSDVVHDYHQAIVHGALYRLFRNPGATWANGDAASMHWKEFEAGIKRARTEVNLIPTQRQE